MNKKINQLSFVDVVKKTIVIVGIYMLATEVANATTLEEQLDKIGTLSSTKLKTIGISSATILSSIWAVVRGNLRLAGAIIAVGVAIGYYLEWVTSGMKFG